LAAELRDTLGVESALNPGGKGIFDVELDGRLIYSKYETHRFPNPGEVEQLIRTFAKGDGKGAH
jgi:selT/selW/selH-like putative selenoprotein